MTIPMLSGWADSLKSLPELGNTLAHILNPQMDVQRQLQMAVAQNPEIAQHLANLEAQNPGIIGKMFGQNNQGINSIAGMSPDLRTQVDIASQPAIKTALADPTNMGEIVENTLGIKSPEQRQLEKNRLAVSGNEVTTSGQQVQLNNAALQDRQDQIARDTLAKTAMGKKPFNPATFDTDYTPEEQAAILGSKLYGDNVNRRLLAYGRQQEQKLMLQMRREDRADARQAATDNFVRNRNLMMGQSLFEKSGGAVLPSDALTLATPEGQAKAAALVASGDTKSSLAQGYLWLHQQQQAATDAISNKQDLMNERKARNQQRQTQLQSYLNEQFQKSLANAKALLKPDKNGSVDPSMVNAALDGVNYAAAQAGRHVTFTYASPGPHDFLGFKFGSQNPTILAVDHDNGNRTYDAETQGLALLTSPPPAQQAASAPVSKPASVQQTPKTLSPAAEKAKAILASDPSKKQTIIDHYPDVAKELGLIQ